MSNVLEQVHTPTAELDALINDAVANAQIEAKKKNCLWHAVSFASEIRALEPSAEGLEDYDVTTGFIIRIDVSGDPSLYTHPHVYNFVVARSLADGSLLAREADAYDVNIADPDYVDFDRVSSPICLVASADPELAAAYASRVGDKYYAELAEEGLRDVRVPYTPYIDRAVYLGAHVGEVAAQELLSSAQGKTAPDKSIVPKLMLRAS